jgi:hypothetical protein
LKFDPTGRTLTTEKARLPTGLKDLGIAIWGGKLYTFGGSAPTSNRIFRIDPADMKVEIMEARLPSHRSAVGAISVPKGILLLGGTAGAGEPWNEVVLYRPEFDKPESATIPWPASSFKPTATVFDSEVQWIFGGPDIKYIVTGSFPPFQVHRYDVKKDSVLALNPGEAYFQPGFLSIPGRAGIGFLERPTPECPAGCAYFFGGNEPDCCAPTDAIVRFDPVSRTSTQLHARLPAAVFSPEVVAAGDRLVVLGGTTTMESFTATDTIVEYDPGSDQIEVAPQRLPWKWDGLQAFWTGTEAIVVHPENDRGEQPELASYDPRSNHLDVHEVPLLEQAPRGGFIDDAFWLQGRGYLVGTGGWHCEPSCSTIYEFDPETHDVIQLESVPGGACCGPASPADHFAIVTAWRLDSEWPPRDNGDPRPPGPKCCRLFRFHPANSPPAAGIMGTIGNEAVRLSSSSKDLEGKVVSLEWRFGREFVDSENLSSLPGLDRPFWRMTEPRRGVVSLLAGDDQGAFDFAKATFDLPPEAPTQRVAGPGFGLILIFGVGSLATARTWNRKR